MLGNTPHEHSTRRKHIIIFLRRDSHDGVVCRGSDETATRNKTRNGQHDFKTSTRNYACQESRSYSTTKETTSTTTREEDYATAADSEDDANVLEEDAQPATEVDSIDIKEEINEELDEEDLGAPQRVIEDPEDDFLVGDSDEEPDSVLDRMKDTGGKMEDLVDENVESDMKVASSIKKPKQKKGKSKKHKKSKDVLVRPEADKKKSKKKKTKKKKAKSKKLSEEKEAIHTALSSKLQGSHQLQVLKSSNMQNVAKGVVLAVLIALTLLVLRVLENSVSAAVPKK